MNIFDLIAGRTIAPLAHAVALETSAPIVAPTLTHEKGVALDCASEGHSASHLADVIAECEELECFALTGTSADYALDLLN